MASSASANPNAASQRMVVMSMEYATAAIGFFFTDIINSSSHGYELITLASHGGSAFINVPFQDHEDERNAAKLWPGFVVNGAKRDIVILAVRKRHWNHRCNSGIVSQLGWGAVRSERPGGQK